MLAIAGALVLVHSAAAAALSLDGIWNVIPDRGDSGLQAGWWNHSARAGLLSKPIPVPGNTYQALSGFNGIAWYEREFVVRSLPASGRRSFLRFGAVQYLCQVWLNGQEVGRHEGGESPFEFEISGRLRPGTNSLVLRVINPPGIFRNGHVPVLYDQGGMIGHVELVDQPSARLADVDARPNSASGAIAIAVSFDNTGAAKTLSLQTTVTERRSGREIDRLQRTISVPSGSSLQNVTLQVKTPHRWDLDDPFLYRLEVQVGTGAEEDIYCIERLGFRDFRIVNGFFELNGRRIFLKSCHHNYFDPVLYQGVTGNLAWIKDDAAKLKSAGFNMFRSISTTLLPDQLAIADETGLLIYSEHQGAWILRDATKFRVGLLDSIRRDRSSPSLVMWGLLNETNDPDVFAAARDSLAAIRAVDDTRVIMLSSGRWDNDLTYGSASNPGSLTWDVFLGGEGPDPQRVNPLPDMATNGDNSIPPGGYVNGAGDVHIYNTHPNSWRFITAIRTLGAHTRPVFVSEAGCGSANDPYTERNDLLAAKAPWDALAWTWVNQHMEELETIWKRYDLTKAYPEIPAMIADSQFASARERELFTRALRANPQISGYSLTSMTDAGGAAEGIWDNFRGWKAGHEAAVKAGWAPTRLCLFANPSPIISGDTVRLVAVLADEGRLAPGAYAVTLRLRDNAGTERWTTKRSVTLEAFATRPFATVVFDEDLTGIALPEGDMTIEADIEGLSRLPGDRLTVPVFSTHNHPSTQGPILALGLSSKAQSVLAAHGAKISPYDPAAAGQGLVIVCGAELSPDWNADSWRHLYSQVAQGAHLVILEPTQFKDSNGALPFFPVSKAGKIAGNKAPAIYHREIIAIPGPVFERLPARLLTPEVYGPLLEGPAQINGATPPSEVLAMAFNGSGYGSIDDGIVIGTWIHGAGCVTICTLDLPSNLGTPVPDRLFLNLVRYAQESRRSDPVPKPALQ